MKKLYMLIGVSILGIISLMVFSSKKEFTILSQELLYDSINYKNGFNVSLYTNILFNQNEIKLNEYNCFLIIIKKDTFPLVPTVNCITKNNKSIKIKFTSFVNLKSKTFENDSLSKIILNSSKIINGRGLEIKRNKDFFLRTLVALPIFTKKDSLLFKYNM
jgi:hypothetical protein